MRREVQWREGAEAVVAVEGRRMSVTDCERTSVAELSWETKTSVEDDVGRTKTTVEDPGAVDSRPQETVR